MDSKNSKETILPGLMVVVLVLPPTSMAVLVLGLVQLPVPRLQLLELPAQQQALPAGTVAMCFAGQAQKSHLS